MRAHECLPNASSLYISQYIEGGSWATHEGRVASDFTELGVPGKNRDHLHRLSISVVAQRSP